MSIMGHRARFAALAAGIAGFLGAAPALAASIFVNADITTSQTWTASTEYILTDRIYVTNGATLTIEAGVTVRGEPEEGALRLGPIEIHAADHRTVVAGKPLTLTVTEFRLIEDLVRARGRVRTRETLLAEVWGYDSEVLSRTVDTHVRRLRSKLGVAADRLVTVRGVGYRIQDPADER